ncbi:MAG: hypothetical protein E3K37_05705 [Candidatus Kuenenia sp.]|nr:hypothetical protein [Candidatus Kuenenia hertensis]
MEKLNLSDLIAETKKNVESFLLDILSYQKENIISIYLIGSAITKDFDLKHSDINTLIILKDIKVSFFDFIASLGKRYGKKKLHAPLLMTKNYINRSVAEFPLEFFDMKLNNQLAYGEDVLKDIIIEKADVRIQCERELKSSLQQICQGYIRAMGNKTILRDLFKGIISGYFPIFRGILFLYDQKIPKEKNNVLDAIRDCCNIKIDPFTRLLAIKAKDLNPSIDELKEIFEELYHEIDTLSGKIDEFKLENA